MKNLEIKNGKTADELGIVLLESFADVVRERLNFSREQVQCYIANIESDVFISPSKGRYRESKKQCPIFSMKNDCFTLDFCQHDNKTVEIYWLEMKEKCKGKGTEIMNTILDTAEEFGVNIRIIPTDFATTGTNYDIYSLRRWYISFGFINSVNYPAVFTYKAA